MVRVQFKKNKKNGAHKAVYHFGWTSRLRNLLRNSPLDCFSQICPAPNLEQLVVGSSPIQKKEKNGAHKAVCRFGWISRLRNLLRNSPQDCFFQICLRQIWSSLSLVRVTTEIKENRYAYAYRFSFGSPSWTRTNDPAVNSRMLYQLSY